MAFPSRAERGRSAADAPVSAAPRTSPTERGADALAFHVIATRLERALAGRGRPLHGAVQLEIRGHRRTFHGVLRVDGRRLEAQPGIACERPAARVVVPFGLARAIATGADDAGEALEVTGDVALVQALFERMESAPGACSWLGVRSST